jgi:hypothetical protein
VRRIVVVYLALQVAAVAVLPLLSAFTASKVAELRAVLEVLAR